MRDSPKLASSVHVLWPKVDANRVLRNANTSAPGAIWVGDRIYWLLANISPAAQTSIIVDSVAEKSNGTNLKYTAQRWLGECELAQDEHGYPLVTLQPMHSTVLLLHG